MTHLTLVNDVHIVNITWPLNAHWADKTIQAFQDMAGQEARRIVVNMDHVPFIDSHGLAALIKGIRAAGSTLHHVCLAAPQAQAKLFLQITRYDRVFHIDE